MKKILIAAGFLWLVCVPLKNFDAARSADRITFETTQGKFVADKRFNKYHRPNCRRARRIGIKNLITFDSKKEAQRLGYIPCKICKP